MRGVSGVQGCNSPLNLYHGGKNEERRVHDHSATLGQNICQVQVVIMGTEGECIPHLLLTRGGSEGKEKESANRSSSSKEAEE